VVLIGLLLLLFSADAAARPFCVGHGLAPRAATLHQLRSSMLCLVNGARGRRGLHLLGYDRHLRDAATGHSRDQSRHGFMSHVGSRGSSMTSRIVSSGYGAWSKLGEDIGGGIGSQGSPLTIFREWMHDGPHRANILDPRFRDFGVGVWRGFPFGGDPDRAATYTIDFARPG
jgi:uncharacterized protein YkwD